MAASDPLIGKKLGDYIIVDNIGSGGMARVYRGLDKKLNRYAAVKVIDAHLVAEQDQEEYRMRFQNEARAIARLNHPHIVGIYQFDQVGTIYYMAMSFIEGRDLRWVLKNHLKNNTRMAYNEILRVVIDMTTALDFSHANGVIHRDIKPSNIMVKEDGHAVLTDFGLALSVPEGTIGTTFGSAHYIAPEQAISSAQAVPQSDLYSLGIVLYEMLSGRVPFEDASAMSVALKHISETPPPPSNFNPNLSPRIEAVVMKALNKEVSDRYASGAEMARALELAFAESENKATPIVAPLPGWQEKPKGVETEVERSTLKPISPLKERGVLDDDPTVTDSRSSKPIRDGLTASQIARRQQQKSSAGAAQTSRKQSSNRGLIVGLVAAVAVIAIVAVVVFLGSGANRAGDADQTATQSALIALAVTQTQAAQASPIGADGDKTLTPTIPPTAEATSAATPSPVPPTMVVPTTEASIQSPTDVPTIASPTTEATTAAPTLDQTPDATATVTTSGSTLPVVLRYDKRSLVLFNQSANPVDVSNLTFQQVGSQARPFESRLWEGGPRPTWDLPAGNCFQLWTNDTNTLKPPDYCTKRQAWSQIATQNAFWVSNDANATFEVRRDDEVLAVCQVSAGECAFDPKGKS